MTTLIAIAAASLGATVAPNGVMIEPGLQDPPPSVAVLTMMKAGGGGVGYEPSGRLDLVALVRPVGTPVVEAVPGSNATAWYARQRFEVLDSPDYQGTILTAYYYVHGVTDPEHPFSGRNVPARPMQLDEGRYLLVGRRQADTSIQFDLGYDRSGHEFQVASTGGLNASVTGLFAVNSVTWAESGPRWRFVMETIAASMAHARSGALEDMTFMFRRLLNTAVPYYEGDGLDIRHGGSTELQEGRLLRIVRDVIAQTETSATTEQKVYYRSVLAHYYQDVEAFIDIAHRLVVTEHKEMPLGFDWPNLSTHRNALIVPKGEYQTKLLEIAETSIDARTQNHFISFIVELNRRSEQRRYFALVPQRTVGRREASYKKLIKWLSLTDITVQTEDDGHGRTVRIVNEDAVRARIASALGV